MDILAPDRIYFNGTIVTMDESRPLLDAVAVKGSITPGKSVIGGD